MLNKKRQNSRCLNRYSTFFLNKQLGKQGNGEIHPYIDNNLFRKQNFLFASWMDGIWFK